MKEQYSYPCFKNMIEACGRLILRNGYVVGGGRFLDKSTVIRFWSHGLLPEAAPLKRTHDFIWPFKDLRIYDLSDYRTCRKVIPKAREFKTKCHVCLNQIRPVYKAVYIDNLGLLVCHNCHDMVKYIVTDIFAFLFESASHQSHIVYIQKKYFEAKATELKSSWSREEVLKHNAATRRRLKNASLMRKL